MAAKKKSKTAKKATKKTAKAKAAEENEKEVKALRMLFRKTFLASLLLVVGFILLSFVWVSIVRASSTLTASFIVLYLILIGCYALYLGELFASRQVKLLKKKHGKLRVMLWKGFLE